MLLTENVLRRIIAEEYKKLMEGEVVDFAAARNKKTGAEKSPKKELDQDMVKFFFDNLQQAAEILVKDKDKDPDLKFLWALRSAPFIKTKIKKNPREAANALVTLGANMLAPEEIEEFKGVVDSFMKFVKNHSDAKDVTPGAQLPPLDRPEKREPRVGGGYDYRKGDD